MNDEAKYVNKLFKITNFIDNARWDKEDNHILINFSHNNLDPDEKLLTHWLLYITTRQMDFNIVQDIGGFVISDLVHAYKNKNDLRILDPTDDDSFFISRESYEYLENFDIKGENDKFLFVSDKQTGENSTLKSHGFEKHQKPYFIPRFYPADFKAIYSTLQILQDDYNKGLGEFIKSLLEKIEDGPTGIDNDELVPKLMFGLYTLSYKAIGQVKADQIFNDFDDFKKNELEERFVKIKKILEGNFEDEFKKFKDKKSFFDKTKRSWSAVRDFLKHKKTNSFLIESLKKANCNYYDNVSYKNLDEGILKKLEIPGDVWNNNPTFKKCIIPKSYFGNLKNLMEEEIGNGRRDNYVFGEYIRGIFKKFEEEIEKGYPEQFDITFDLVSRMCDNKLCEICPYGLINNGDPYDILKDNKTKFKKLCHGNVDMYCPILLSSCHYKFDCVGKENCDFWMIYNL